MTYDDWNISAITKRFGLNVRERAITVNAYELPLDPRLRHLLDRDRSVALGSNTAKARAEFLVAPILANVTVPWNPRLRIFSGKDMSVAPDLGLSGVCDFVFSRSRQLSCFQPFFLVLTVGDEDLAAGLGPCVARLIGARLLNEKEQVEEPVLFGLITSGLRWRFLQLRNHEVLIDSTEYDFDRIDHVHSILAAMLDERPVLTETEPN